MSVTYVVLRLQQKPWNWTVSTTIHRERIQEGNRKEHIVEGPRGRNRSKKSNRIIAGLGTITTSTKENAMNTKWNILMVLILLAALVGGAATPAKAETVPCNNYHSLPRGKTIE